MKHIPLHSLNYLKNLKKSEVTFDKVSIQAKIKKMENLTYLDTFWDDTSKANKTIKEINYLKKELNFFDKIEDQYEIIKLHIDENENNEIVNDDAIDDINLFSKQIQNLEIKTLLSNEDDKKDVILSIHPGAGGKESQDWAAMLYRMYIRWCEINSLKYKILNYQDGDEAGIKDVSIEIKGEYLFGKLKSERGVHRLIRISPFDSNSRRHTSFAAVDIDPIIDDDIDIEILDKDLKIDTYRASGAGGQHVNKTDSAVRITHLPSGIVVQCQNERSQLKNKKTAMKLLKSKIYQLMKDEINKEKNNMNAEKKEIGWGSQIRSYIFHPYNLVKDHRSKHENSNINFVMDGNINEFIRNYLLSKMEITNAKN